MSYVTSVTIVVGYASDAFRAAVTAENDFGRDGYPVTFRELDPLQSGGTKVLQQDLFAAGLNYADREAIREWCDSLPWWGTFGAVVIDTEGESPEVWTYGHEQAVPWGTPDDKLTVRNVRLARPL